MSGPLEGLLVIDAGWGMPTAVTGMLLADFGAHVLKVERPGGGPDRASVTRSAWDRGKWSVELDLDAADGVEQLHGLLAGADVFVESFGAGRGAEFGLGPADVARRHGHLVHCAMTAYGQDGPWRDRPGWDALIAANFGATTEQMGHRPGPTFLGHPSIGYCSAFVAVIATLAAVRVRELTGQGQLVDVSVLDGLLAQSPMNWWWNEADLSYLARSGDTKGFGRTRLIADPFLCQDGEYLMMHTGGAGSFKRALDILGVGEKIRAIPGLEMAVPLDDDEYDIARNVVPARFLDRPRDEWLKLFQDADVAALPVYRPGEVLGDDQVHHAGLVVEVDDPQFGPLRQVGPVIQFEKCPAGRPTPAPTVGQHNDRLAGLLGRTVAAPPSPRRLAHPLEGLRVLDFSSFFATAYGAKFLADLGADVIKVEAPTGDQMRPAPDPFEASQRGKRNLCVDLRDPAGLEVVLDLVRSSDIVMHNLRPGKAERLGIGYRDLTALNPQLIYGYFPGFGSTGPKAAQKSFAPLISGMCGLLYEAAGEGNPPIPRAMGNEDYYNGFLAAVAMLMALRHRDWTGEGQYVELPQLHACLFTTSHRCLDASGTVVPTLQLDKDQLGWGPLYRIYRTCDGAICLSCVGAGAFGRLRDALGLHRGPDDDGLAAELERRFAALTQADAFALLDGAGVPCEVVRPDPFLPDFLWDEWAFDTGRVFEHHHPKFGFIRELGLLTRLSATPGVNQGPGALLGQHTGEILEGLGYDGGRIETLLGSVCRPTGPGAPSAD
jgi:crotonobetainyl-CoA:carnitine CoA-transferase CaiB-like acyl-CoA transferase